MHMPEQEDFSKTRCPTLWWTNLCLETAFHNLDGRLLVSCEPSKCGRTRTALWYCLCKES